MQEIIAARIGTLITSHPPTISKALNSHADVEFLDRQFVERMSRIFPQERWISLAKSPAIMFLREDGIYIPAPSASSGDNSDTSPQASVSPERLQTVCTG